MEFVGLGIGVLGVVDICLRYGQQFVTYYNDYRDATSEVAEQRLRAQHCWLKIEQEISLLRKTHHVLEARLQAHLGSVLEVLQGKLLQALGSFNRVQGRKGVKAAKYALLVKNSIDSAVTDLESWCKMFEPRWFMIVLSSSPLIDESLEYQMENVGGGRGGGAVSTMKGIRDALKSGGSGGGNGGAAGGGGGSVWLPTAEMYLRNQIGESSAQVVYEHTWNRDVIVDIMTVDPQRDISGTTKDVRDLAKLLTKADPAMFGILACRGVIKRNDDNGRLSRFEFVFGIPDGLGNPRCLRTLLLKQEHAGHPLDERFALAKSLARSVMFVHNSNFVHKNIRPETIIVFESPSGTLGVPFLVGFEKFRAADGRTYLTGDENWERNLYRHPSRQGSLPEEAYKMQHDIYSLGVCLLEIGLWSPFVCDSNTVGNAVANVHRYLSDRDVKRRATSIKRELTLIATNRLPSRMGKRYTEAVLSCLTCLDKDGGFGDESEFCDEDGILVGVRYIEKILGTLEEIVV